MHKSTGQTLFTILLISIMAAACTPATAKPEPTTAPAPTPLSSDTMILIPAGSFNMGNTADQALAECSKYRNDCVREWYTMEEPVHAVDVPAFYMGVYEVTNGLYKVCVNAGKCQPPRLKDSRTHPDYYDNPLYGNYPVINVNWDNAKTYCEWSGGRLPTEAEWEKAARGTDGRTFPWGEGIDTTRANYGDTKHDPVAVGSYESGKSPYGMYDMTGNVWEWVADWFDVYPGGDPKASPDFGQKNRVLRGGAWLDPANSSHAAFRGSLDPTHSFGNIGFRCAKDAK